MRLQTKLLLSIISLLVVTVIAVSYFTVTSTTRSMLAQTEQDGQAVSQLLAQSSVFAERIPGQVDKVLGEQMVVEARITAQLVAVAVGRAGMSPEEIKAILKDITDNTVLDEFWITDDKGHAYLTNTDIDFTFSPDPAEQPQAYVFYRLLGEKNGVVIQQAQKREIDTKFFKYVGVSGIDQPRIVQVGYEADIIDELSKDMNIQKLVDELTGQANVATIRVLNSKQEDIAVSSQPVSGIGTTLSEGDKKLLDEAMSSKEMHSALQDNILRVANPVLGENGDVQTAILVYLTTENLQAAIRDTILRCVLISLIVIAAGVLLSFLISNGITRPIRKLTAAVQVMGKGDLSRMVEVETKDEVGVLAHSFNKMAEDLKSYIEDLRRTTAEKERVEKELEIGRGIQQSFLPEAPPEVPGFDIAALNSPALEVGGDFYDFIPVALDKWGLVIADVSGKGVPAALFMALSRTLIRANAVDNPTVSQAILKANKMIAEQDRANMFVTLFYGVLDTGKKTITYVNAGHNPPLVLSKKGGDIVMLAAKGIALGIMSDITLEEKEVPLREGDVVILFTDGVTESINRKQEQFGQERLIKLIEENRTLSAREIVNKIEQKVAVFSEGQSQFDDLTLVAVKVL
jgi:sigma-B regulation protein RsbU (phosphoserine phosphatase)